MHNRDYRSNNHPPTCTCVKCSKTMNKRRINQIYNRRINRKRGNGGVNSVLLLIGLIVVIFLIVFFYYDLEIYDKPEMSIGGDNFGPNHKLEKNEPEYINEKEKTNLKNLNKQEEIIEIKKFALDLINKQRLKANLNEVIQGDNPAAQILANHSFETKYYGDLLRNGKSADMVYSENKGNSYFSVYANMSGFFNENEDGTNDWLPDQNCRRLSTVVTCMHVQPKNLISSMIMDEEFKEFILNPAHKIFNLGIEYDRYLLYLYFSFEGGDFIVEEMKIENGFLTFSILNNTNDYFFSDNSIQLYFEQPPKEIFYEIDYIIQENYNESIHNVEYARILKPLPPDIYYTDLNKNDFIANEWSILENKLKVSVYLGDKLNPLGFYSIRVWGKNINTSEDNLLIDYGILK